MSPHRCGARSKGGWAQLGRKGVTPAGTKKWEGQARLGDGNGQGVCGVSGGLARRPHSLDWVCAGERNQAGNRAPGRAVSLERAPSPRLTLAEWRTVMRARGLITFGTFL